VFKRKAKSDKPVKSAKAKKREPAKAAKAAKAVKPAKKVRAAQLGPVRKQPTDIYTVMLMIALAAVLIACVLLVLELNRFGSYPWWKAS
jgi:hypothetical protein